MRFLSESHSKLYTNAVCFEDLSELEINSNWWEEQFSNPFIIIEGCKSTTKNGGLCKTAPEIDDFMVRSIFYLVGQKTIVDKSIYKDTAKDFKTDEEYFPLRIDND